MEFGKWEDRKIKDMVTRIDRTTREWFAPPISIDVYSLISCFRKLHLLLSKMVP